MVNQIISNNTFKQFTDYTSLRHYPIFSFRPLLQFHHLPLIQLEMVYVESCELHTVVLGKAQMLNDFRAYFC